MSEIQDADDAVRLVRGMLRRGEEGEAFRERRLVVSWSGSEAGLVSPSVTEERGTAVRIRRGTNRLLVARGGNSPEALRAAVRDAARRVGSSPFLKRARPEDRRDGAPAALPAPDGDLGSHLQAVLARSIADPRGIALSLRVSHVVLERAVITPHAAVLCSCPSRVEVQGTIRRTDSERVVSFQSTRPPLAALEAFGILLAEALRPAVSAIVREGETDVVLSPAAAATFWHEAVGHPLEAEKGEPASVLSRVPGAAVAPPGIDVYDDPGRDDLPGSFLYDDEGTPAERVPLITDGVVTGSLSDHLTGGARSNGHGRTSDFRRPPRPRMSNLVVAPGRRREEELIADCGEGLRIREISSGSAEPESGRFVLFVEGADLIRKGRLGARVGRFILTGDLLKALSSIDGSPSDRALPSPGLSLCMKGGDPLPVGGAASALLVRSLLVRPFRR